MNNPSDDLLRNELRDLYELGVEQLEILTMRHIYAWAAHEGWSASRVLSYLEKIYLDEAAVGNPSGWKR